jgi:Histone acetylation protein/TAZ zinc finger/Zinc finger, ZZ type
MLQRYSDKRYPSEFPLRSKCIALFQRIHGVDTLLFALYVYEYGDDCPLPNRRLVYISYLDSVRYFEPKCYRTTAYHSIMVEYLRYVKKRGFHSAYIWSCPPVGGDDYIFYCHPKHQLVPREDMLRSWYHKMLDQAKTQGIVIRTSTLYDDFFTNDGGDADPIEIQDPTCLPYFEGDYIPGEIEIIIQQLEESGEAAVVNSSHDSVMVRLGHQLMKMKDNFIVVQLRSRRFIDAVQLGQDVTSWKEDSDDEIIRSKRAKISSKSPSESYSPKIQSSASFATPSDSEKQDFAIVQVPIVSSTFLDEHGSSSERTGDVPIVAESLGNLDAEADIPNTKVVGDGVQKLGHESDNVAIESIAKEEFKDDPSYQDIETNVGSKAESHAISQTVGTVPNEPSFSVSGVERSPTDVVSATSPLAEGKDVKENDGLGQLHEAENSTPTDSIDKGFDAQTNDLSLGKLSDVPSNKRVLDEIKPAIESHLSGRNGIAVADTTDEDPPMDNEMFESRQQFLNYCQATHCQFDELRRAKHSTVMLLFQLHNPSAPKFLQQCGACYRDITHGIRHHCNECSNFDLCHDCYEPVVTGLWAKRDPRFAHDESHSFSPIDMETTEESQKSISDRLKSLKAHVELLEHAGACAGSPTCSLHNCDRLKKLFLHVPSCDIKPKRECKICTRLLVLCTMHARLCTSRGSCPIPFCDRIRERNKRLRRQQQLMDDRRRQAQNELYHAGGEV